MGVLQGAGELPQLVAAVGQGGGYRLSRFLIVLQIGKPSRESGEGTYDTMREKKNEAAEGGGHDQGRSKNPAAEAGEPSFLFADEDEVILRSGQGRDGEVMAVDLDGDGFASSLLPENTLEIVRPPLVGRTGDGPASEIKGHLDLEDGGEFPGHLGGARKGDFSHHESGVPGSGLLEAPHRFLPVEGRDPDCQPEGGEEDESGERNDEPAVEASAPRWWLDGHWVM